jgi:tetratricopeptide (TPR) repeat protein
MQGDISKAQARYEESLSLRRELGQGNTPGAAQCLNNLGTLASDRGLFAEARAHHEKSLAMRQQLGDEGGVAQSLYNLGEVALRRGDHSESRRRLRESLGRLRVLGGKMLIVQVLGAVARLAQPTGELERAGRWFGGAAGLRRSIKMPLARTHRARYERSIAEIRSGLGDARLQALWAAGESAALEEIITEVLRWTQARPANDRRRIRQSRAMPTSYGLPATPSGVMAP